MSLRTAGQMDACGQQPCMHAVRTMAFSKVVNALFVPDGQAQLSMFESGLSAVCAPLLDVNTKLSDVLLEFLA